MIKLSIVIANLNTKKLTLECIASIYKQNLPFSFEVIVVDDGSNDGSVEALAEIQKERKNYKFIANKKNSGYAKANNKGLKVAKGEYWLLLNSDTVVKKNALENLIKFADETSDAGVVGSRLYNADGSLQPSCFRFPTIKNAILEYWFGRKGLFEKFAPKGEEAVEVNSVVGAAFLITPEAKKRVGMLDERYWAYFEDMDYCRQVWKKGLKVYYLPKSEIIHYHGASFKKLADEKNRWRKLIPSSKIYHGVFKHYLFNSIIWVGQKAKINWKTLLKTFSLKYFWILAVVLAIPATLALFHRGFFPTHDYIYVARIQQMFEALKDVQFPVRWVSGFRYGEPLYNFYAPLPYYLGALVHWVGFSYLTTAKVLYALSFVLSSVTMFFLARKFLANWPSLAISALYVYAPYRSVDIYVRGALSEAWTFVFFPLIILFTIQLTEKFGKKVLGLLILSLAGLFLTHNILTMLFIPFYLIFCVFWWWKDRSWALVRRIVIALGVGIGLAATYLFPAFLEKSFVQTQNLTQQYFNYLGHFVALRQFIVPSWGYGASLWGPVDDMSFQIGLVHWGVFALAMVLFIIVFGKIKDKGIKVWFPSTTLLFILSLFFQHNKSTFIWQLFPPLGFVQFPWRFLALSVFFISLAGIPAFYLMKKKLVFWLSLLVIVLAVVVNIGYFKPDMYYNDSIDAHYVSKETLSIDSKLPKDYLPILVKVIKEEKITTPQVLAGEAKIDNYQQKGTRVSLTVNSAQGATVEVPATYFPGWQARVNGQKVETFAGDELGLVAFKVPGGESEVSVKFGDTPIRTVSNIVSLISLGIVLLLFCDTKGKIKLFIRDNKFFLAGLLLSLVVMWPLSKSGYFTHHDDVQVIRLHQMNKCIEDFQIPCRWVPDLGGLYGYPLFNYYGSLPYYFGEIFYLILGNLIVAAKIMFGFSFVGSYVFMYLLGKKLWGSQLGGAISGIFYAYAPYHAVDFYVRGAMGEMWALMFVPAVFWAILEYAEKKKVKHLLLAALFTALLVVSHNLSLMMFLPFIIGFGLLLVIKNKNIKLGAYLLAALIFGFCLSAFYVLPAYFEKNLVHVDTTTMGYFSYTEHFKGLRKLLVERMWGWGASVREIPGGEKDGMSFQIGWGHLVAFVLTLIGLTLNFKKPLFKKYFWEIAFFTLALGVGVFMIHPSSVKVWDAIPPLKYLQFPWRFLMLVIFAISTLAGSVAVWFKKDRLKVVVAILFALGIVGLNFSYFRPEKFLAITQEEYLTGKEWDKQIKRSIFDYLPIYAKAPPAELADYQYKVIEGTASISDFQKGSNRFSFKVEAKENSRILLAQYYFPRWKIMVDGKSAEINYQNDLGLMNFEVPKGEHWISGKLHDTPLRTFSNWLTILSIGAFVLISVKKNLFQEKHE